MSKTPLFKIKIPEKIPLSIESQRRLVFLQNAISRILDPTQSIFDEIYLSLDHTKHIIIMNYCILYKYGENYMIYIYDITYNDKTIILINNVYYKSSGKSRNECNRDHWFEGGRIDAHGKVIKGEIIYQDITNIVKGSSGHNYKGEDIFFNGISVFNSIIVFNSISVFNNKIFGFYSRFLNENNVYIDMFLRNHNNELDLIFKDIEPLLSNDALDYIRCSTERDRYGSMLLL